MEKMLNYSSKGTATPDHVIRVKPFPLVITPKPNSSIEDFKITAESALKIIEKNTSVISIKIKKAKEKKLC